MKQIKELEAERKKMAEQNANNNGNGNGKIILNQDGKQIELNNEQIVGLLKNQQENIQQLHKQISEKNNQLILLENKLKEISLTHSKLDEIKELLELKLK